MRSIFLSAALSMLLAATCPAQGPRWSSVDPAVKPAARLEHAMVYDSARRRAVLFGGTDGSTLLGDTWEWDGRGWQRLTPTASPPARREHAMAYDASRKVTVLFGGWDGTKALADTWEWDGTNWSLRSTTASPPARVGHAMAYDAARQQTVLFGGDNGTTSLADTWLLSGTSWTQATPSSSPPARNGHAMAFDSARNRVVVHGGRWTASVSDTWTWDGSNWSLASTSGPRPSYGHGLAYDPGRGVTVLFGGRDGSIIRSATWEWDGSRWTEIVPLTLPSARYGHAMVFDTASRRTLLFGSHVPTSDTWLYGYTAASYTSFGSGCASGSQGCTVCLARNWTKTLANKTTTATMVAILDFHSEPMSVCGADLYMAARTGTVKVNVAIYDFDGNTGEPGKAVRSGSVDVGTAGAYGVTFPQLKLGASEIFYIVFDNADKLILPVSTTGTDQLYHARRGSSWGALQSDLKLEYQVRCDRGRQVPVLSGKGKPIPGQTLTVELDRAPGNRPGVMFLGASDVAWGPFQLPLSLAPAAPGCSVLASGEVALGFVTTTTGTHTIPIRIPNDATLKNLQFYNQFFVVDPSANALGLVVSNGAAATIGDS